MTARVVSAESLCRDTAADTVRQDGNTSALPSILI